MYTALLMLLKVTRLTRFVREIRYLSAYEISIMIDFNSVKVGSELTIRDFWSYVRSESTLPYIQSM